MKRFAVALILALTACSNGRDTYTLYRSSTTGPMRIHVATFDTDNEQEYNAENCRATAVLFERQPGVKVRYWCEKGRYNP